MLDNNQGIKKKLYAGLVRIKSFDQLYYVCAPKK